MIINFQPGHWSWVSPAPVVAPSAHHHQPPYKCLTYINTSCHGLYEPFRGRRRTTDCRLPWWLVSWREYRLKTWARVKIGLGAVRVVQVWAGWGPPPPCIAFLSSSAAPQQQQQQQQRCRIADMSKNIIPASSCSSTRHRHCWAAAQFIKSWIFAARVARFPLHTRPTHPEHIGHTATWIYGVWILTVIGPQPPAHPPLLGTKVTLLHCLNRQLWSDIVHYNYRVFPSNKQKWNWKIDTSLVAMGAQYLFFSLYKLGVNFLWIREI